MAESGVGVSRKWKGIDERIYRAIRKLKAEVSSADYVSVLSEKFDVKFDKFKLQT